MTKREREEAVARAAQMQRERDAARGEARLWLQHSQHAFTFADQAQCSVRSASLQPSSHRVVTHAPAGSSPEKLATPRTARRGDGARESGKGLSKTVMDGVVYIHQDHARAEPRDASARPLVLPGASPRAPVVHEARKERLCGVGITLVQPDKNGPIRISSIVEGGSLWREMQQNATISDKRLRKFLPIVGDEVLAINGKSVPDVTSAPELVLGPEGSAVSLLIGEAGGRPKASVLLTRRPRQDV
jgi:hypothetical protein